MVVTRGSREAAPRARLLDITDGILGQGLDVPVAIATNEPFARIHPAIALPVAASPGWRSGYLRNLLVVLSARTLPSVWQVGQ
jgi:hypothetical protein